MLENSHHIKYSKDIIYTKIKQHTNEGFDSMLITPTKDDMEAEGSRELNFTGDYQQLYRSIVFPK